MADVIQKVISGNDIVQGAAIIMPTTVIVNYQNLDPKITDPVNISAVEAKYTDRFK